MDGNRLTNLILEASKKANPNSDKADLIFGTVLSVEPIKVKIENNGLELTSSFLILSPFCYNNGTIWSGLKTNDKVVMLRANGGQRYLIMHKVKGW